MSAINLTTKKIGNDEIAILTFDLPNEKVNKLSTPVMTELKAHIEKLQTSNYKMVVFKSAKPKIFIAGADIEEIQKLKTPQEVQVAVSSGQTIFNQIEDLPMPTLALVHGACAGGGCELILACDYRIATDDSSTRIGLPETKLGILPGFGGCIRLPRTVGLQASLDVILAGKLLNPKKALKIGLVDYVVHVNLLDGFAETQIQKILAGGAKKRRKTFQPRGVVNKLLEGPLKGVVFKKAREGVLKATRGHYPAPLAALDVVRKTYGMSDRTRALQIELEHFAECAVTDISKNLIHVFYLTEMVKKQTGVSSDVKGKAVKQLGVLGAGTMGGGIAYVAADKGIGVRVKDISYEANAKALKHARDLWAKLVKKKVIDNYQFTQKMALVSTGLDFAGFKNLDVTVEAIVEDMGIKQKVIGQTAAEMREDAIIVTNTSSLSVNEMAKGHPRPEYFAGMHFFSPVHKMPLVEVIRGEKSSDETIATVFELAKKMGKMPVVVKDGPGFLVNRLLLPYMAEAAFLLAEGMSVEKVDKAYVNQFGMPMGPFELMDSVGLDVCVKVLNIFRKAFPDRVEVPALMEKLEKNKARLGQKTNLGFYKYEGGRKTEVDQSIYAELGISAPTNPYSDQECLERGVFAMINESALALDQDKIVDTPHEVDLAMIMGTGFPPFRGGLMKYADTIGADYVRTQLTKYATERKANRLKPSSKLVERADKKARFYN
ncbi:3-hydroxyacyl-CoA dehydrogenase NAD-binding domain-containing protein [Pseudobdellovibrio exovorus]|uniref:enoyl-CoA hydratase n=1 Tax=Pseudobdellovibrio exovorus JSS TaxID=1184267 RepID=M4VA09_9BACT|nr:3-hydroxyacyl-CoA dehydrogenase NAD-binding domain-containing protein [Pseudobdellovibrio exovorus]AGH95300.1 fatty oxidation complex, alpha subunit [Pseudobdellovibrio exovorus JSS]